MVIDGEQLPYTPAALGGSIPRADRDSRSTLTKNLAVGNKTAVSLGSSTASGNSWNIGGTWNDSSLVSTNSAVITGPRTPAGDIPHSDFLKPAGGADVGARI